MNQQRRQRSLLDFVTDLCMYVAAALTGGMAVAIVVGVLGRRLLGQSLPFIPELAETMVFWITFLGIASLSRGDGHVRMEAVDEIVSPQRLRLICIVSDAFTILASIALTAAATWVAVTSYQSGVRMPTLLAWPRWVILAVIPGGSFLVVLQVLRRLRQQVAVALAERQGGGPPP